MLCSSLINLKQISNSSSGETIAIYTTAFLKYSAINGYPTSIMASFQIIDEHIIIDYFVKNTDLCLLAAHISYIREGKNAEEW